MDGKSSTRYVYPVLMTLLGGVLVNFVSEALKYSIDRSLGKSLDSGQKMLIWIVAFVLVGGTMWIFLTFVLTDGVTMRMLDIFNPGFLQRYKLRVESDSCEKTKQAIQRRVGLVEVFSRFSECQEKMLADIESSKEVKLFVLLGGRFMHSTSPLFECIYECLEKKPDFKVRIIHASLDSPYFNQARARERGSDYKKWEADLLHASQVASNFKSKYGDRFDSREHQEPAFWRFFIFDEVVYVQPYLYMKKNYNASVFKFAKKGSQGSESESLYATFLNYFDNKWRENELKKNHDNAG